MHVCVRRYAIPLKVYLVSKHSLADGYRDFHVHIKVSMPFEYVGVLDYDLNEHISELTAPVHSQAELVIGASARLYGNLNLWGKMGCRLHRQGHVPNSGGFGGST